MNTTLPIIERIGRNLWRVRWPGRRPFECSTAELQAGLQQLAPAQRHVLIRRVAAAAACWAQLSLPFNEPRLATSAGGTAADATTETDNTAAKTTIADAIIARAGRAGEP